MTEVKKIKNPMSKTETLESEKDKPLQIGKFLSCLPFGICSQKPVVAVLRLSGVIGGSSRPGGGDSLKLEDLNESIEKAFGFSKLACVCLSVNSPGGSPVQSELIAKRIIDLSVKKKIPVYSFVEDVAASGGYWLACAGEEIYASKSSIIGSVGVISASFGFKEAISKLGIERRVYTQGKNKSILDPFESVKNEDVKIIKSLQKQIYDHFVRFVKSRRKSKLTQEDDILFSGEFWAGQSALDFGLIDGIDDLYGFLERKFGDEVRVRYIGPKRSWIKRKLGSIGSGFGEGFGESMAKSLETKILEDRFKIY